LDVALLAAFTANFLSSKYSQFAAADYVAFCSGEMYCFQDTVVLSSQTRPKFQPTQEIFSVALAFYLTRGSNPSCSAILKLLDVIVRHF
jgi:hypothetical protein